MEREEAIEIARKLYNESLFLKKDKEAMVTLIPELTECEDERIRKAIICGMYALKDQKKTCFASIPINDVIAYLEKQGDHKFADKVEPKFKVGDWIVYHRNDSSTEIMNVYDIRDNRYYFNDNIHFSWSVKECDEKCHLWTIQDAKDGDVLSWDDSKCISIFKNIYDEESFNSYGFVGGCTGTFESRMSYHDIEGTHPATKEQRNALGKAMADAGYTFDFKKKKLKEIEQKPNDKEMKETLRTEYEKGRADVIAEMQNHAWSKEDEKMISDIATYLNRYGNYILNKNEEKAAEIHKAADWIKSLKDKVYI